MATTEPMTRLRTHMAASFGPASPARPERTLDEVTRHAEAGCALTGDRQTPALARMSAVTASGAKRCSRAPQHAKM